MIRSCEEGGGAREAIVWVKDCSCTRTEDMIPLRRSSAAALWACRKSLACRIWAARRSVGVGEEGSEGVGEGGLGLCGKSL